MRYNTFGPLDHKTPTDPTKPYFVYGSLRPGQGNYYNIFGSHLDAITYVDDCKLPGYSMVTRGGFPYILNDEDHTVTGTLITVTDSDVFPEIAQSLDWLEGTDSFQPINNANHYNRLTQLVQLPDGSQVKAWVYAPPLVDQPNLRARLLPVPSGDWNQHNPPLSEAYRHLFTN